MEKLFLRKVNTYGYSILMNDVDEYLKDGWSVKQIVMSPEVFSTHIGSGSGETAIAIVLQK